MSDFGQENVRKFLLHFGLEAVKIPESDQKTPDFEVFYKQKKVFFCEEKTLEKDEKEGAYPDPTYNAISAHIHKATKQFKSLNPRHEFPNVLAFTNLDKGKDFYDLFITITGAAPIGNGEFLTIRSVGRIQKDLSDIDLFLWFDQDSFIDSLPNLNSMFKADLSTLLNIVKDK
ncbi:hypothetical protein CDO73_01755 [Saccharibacillus sp. O23]|uniref:hypothetical protein n=1 Tax=Saccharibacillus sp. O23 TaxID=2009338 RepID=UPI000B4E5B94|nr:hypothetical protein [Saccharibacillus sp. O23]OWR32360.1 hypothetical protein CDO73_01755 [Saccharibacillus sp. O23]